MACPAETRERRCRRRRSSSIRRSVVTCVRDCRGGRSRASTGRKPCSCATSLAAAGSPISDRNPPHRRSRLRRRMRRPRTPILDRIHALAAGTASCWDAHPQNPASDPSRVATGSSGIVVLDLDRPKADSGSAMHGRDALLQLNEANWVAAGGRPGHRHHRHPTPTFSIRASTSATPSPPRSQFHRAGPDHPGIIG